MFRPAALLDEELLPLLLLLLLFEESDLFVACASLIP